MQKKFGLFKVEYIILQSETDKYSKNKIWSLSLKLEK